MVFAGPTKVIALQTVSCGSVSAMVDCRLRLGHVLPDHSMDRGHDGQDLWPFLVILRRAKSLAVDVPWFCFAFSVLRLQ